MNPVLMLGVISGALFGLGVSLIMRGKRPATLTWGVVMVVLALALTIAVRVTLP